MQRTRKRLRLRTSTVRNLTGTALGQAVGGAEDPWSAVATAHKGCPTNSCKCPSTDSVQVCPEGFAAKLRNFDPRRFDF